MAEQQAEREALRKALGQKNRKQKIIRIVDLVCNEISDEQLETILNAVELIAPDERVENDPRRQNLIRQVKEILETEGDLPSAWIARPSAQTPKKLGVILPDDSGTSNYEHEGALSDSFDVLYGFLFRDRKAEIVAYAVSLVAGLVYAVLNGFLLKRPQTLVLYEISVIGIAAFLIQLYLIVRLKR
jgi:hypothetical protein